MRMSRVVAFATSIATSLVLALGACGGDRGTAPSVELPPIPEIPTIPGQPGQPGPSGPPLAVQPVVSAAGRVSRIASPESGATLTTTDPNGTRYTLVIPPKAVFDSIEISMTPLSSVGGLPLSGGLVGGVQLEPDGLRLAQLATLTIEPSGAVDPASLSGFAYYGSGADFHLYRAASAQGKLTMQLGHFSGWGVGKGTAADRAAQLGRVPAHWEAEMMQVLAEGGDIAKVQTGLAMVYLQKVKPLIDRAESTRSLGDIRAALTAALALEQFSQLALGANAPKFVDTVALIRRWAGDYFRALRDRCRNANDLGTAAQMVSLLRQMQLLGVDDGFSLTDVAACLRFELDFDSRIEDHAVADEVHQTTNSVVKVDDLPITSMGAPNVNVLSGEGPTRNVSIATQTNSVCRISYTNLRDGIFRVTNLAVELETRPDSLHPFGGDAIVKSVLLLFDPGEPTERINFLCPNVPPDAGGDTFRWKALFLRLHMAEFHQQAGAFVMRLNPGSGAVIGSRGFNRTVDCSYSGAQATCKEETVVTVYHRPK